MVLVCLRRNASSAVDSSLVQKLNTFFGEKVILLDIVLILIDKMYEDDMAY